MRVDGPRWNVPWLSPTDPAKRSEPVIEAKESNSVHVRYTADQDRIVAEVLEGEVMVVDLASGYYYVLEGTGADLWSLLANGSSVSEAAVALTRRYAASPAEIEAAAADFVNQLLAENLLDPAGDEMHSAAVVSTEAVDVTEAVDAPRPFTLPAMYKYTDMANLVQMDPIRDFEESRWPRRKTSGKNHRP
jgi:hypothetical protein